MVHCEHWAVRKGLGSLVTVDNVVLFPLLELEASSIYLSCNCSDSEGLEAVSSEKQILQSARSNL
jgi:hypothetical protein